ncbi:MAG: amino acid--[acyl-carrier-protein] ligase [Proteobacteria bacterium]|nr:amino acid--[acyl-carrier-protein] ligase [Pseudomonadota bacterium]
MTDTETFLDGLFDAGVLIDTGVEGLYARSGRFEAIIEGIDAVVSAVGGGDGAEVLRFPPGMNRQVFEKTGYMKNFPQLAGTVHCFCGDDAGHAEIIAALDEGRDWAGQQALSEIALTPAACYPLYPLAARRGPLPEDGRLFDILSYCFRHEPSKEATRMQMFRMREFVRMGTPDDVMAFRERWIERGAGIVKTLGLEGAVDLANDPFFGRAGRILKNNQRQQNLKFEMLIPVESQEKPTACMSFNYHQDHFGTLWGLKTADGAVAHTACVGFGMERLALALLKVHGLSADRWPAPVRKVLGV